MLEDLRKQLEILLEELNALEKKFLDGYFPAQPEHEPQIYNHDVKAYCVLSHAVFEEFLEHLSKIMISSIESDFLSRKVTLSTVCFLMYWESKIDREVEKQEKCFDVVRNAINNAKTRHSALIKSNHGFSKKYMQSLLISVGLNLPSELLMDSVNKLADARGAFAHTRAEGAAYDSQYHKATRVMGPDEAKTIVSDCFKACEEMVDRVSKIW